MTFADGKMPPSTDLVRLIAPGSEVQIWCDYCQEYLGKAVYLNQAIKLWTDHQAAEAVSR